MGPLYLSITLAWDDYISVIAYLELFQQNTFQTIVDPVWDH